MQEPIKYSMSTGEPVKKDPKKIPMPKLYPETMTNDIDVKKDIEQELLEIIKDHKNDGQNNQKSN